MPQVSIARLFDDTREKLQLTWVAGRDGADKGLDSELTKDSSKGLVGHLNFIHPNLIQVLGQSEVSHLNGLDPVECRNLLQRTATRELACFIVAGANEIPPALLEIAESTHTPLFSSPIPSVELMWILRPHLARTLADSTTVHGVFLDVLGVGVLITGDSGVGKSELGLELISRGHGLVADDVVDIAHIPPSTLECRCPRMLRDFLEVRGLGMLNIRTIFGETAVRPKMNLRLIVHLERPAAGLANPLERLPLHKLSEEILGVAVRKVVIPVAEGRNLAVLVEAAARNHILQLRGINSTEEFIARQQGEMDENPN